MRAAGCTAIGNATVEIFDDVSVGDLRPGEVRLRMHAAGICASDVSAMNGNLCRCGTYLRIRAAVHKAAELASAGATRSAVPAARNHE